MSNNYWDEEDDEDQDTQEYAGDGSDLLKKLRKAKRADEKRIKELTDHAKPNRISECDVKGCFPFWNGM